MKMSSNVRDLLIIALSVAAYAAIVWIVEENLLTAWKASPHAQFARDHARDAMLAGEFDVTTPVAEVMGEEVPDGSD